MRNAILGLTFAALACSPVQAALTNASFETGDMTGWSTAVPGGYGSGAWVSDNVAQQSQQYPPFGAVLPGTAEGRYYAEISGFGADVPAYAWQDVGPLQPDTKYTLTFAVGGARFDWSPAHSIVSLVNGTDQTGNVLSSADSGSLGFGAYPNNFKDLTTTFTTGSAVTGNLTVMVTTVGGFNNYNSLKYDNVRLVTEAVPEPGTLGLIGCAAMGVLSIRKRYAK